MDDGEYVGSTVESLVRRKTKHKYAAKKMYHNSSLLDKMNAYGFDKFFTELIEGYPCNTKIELLAREGHWIKEIGTLSKTIQGRTQQEWHEEYKDRQRELQQNNPNYVYSKSCM